MIKPFRALRYAAAAGAPETLCCPPYDVVSDAERLELEARSPFNAIRLEHPSDGYRKAAERLREWRDGGILALDEEPLYYIVEMGFEADGQKYRLRGFTALMELTPFGEGRVLPHEETLSKAKADRLELMKAANCNFSPLYGLYEDCSGEAAAVLESVTANTPPQAEFTMPDGVIHRLWTVAGETAQSALTRALGDGPVFIADGHHRYETALGYCGRGGFVMITLVEMSDPGLVVMPTHRVVKNCPDIDLASRLSGAFKIENAGAADVPQNGSVIFYRNGGYKLITPASPAAMSGKSPAYNGLDVAVLHDLILEPHFGIDKKALAAQSSLIYTRDRTEAVRMVDGGAGQCAFILPPTKVSQIRDVSLAGEKMPQKSTYFYPKWTTGITFSLL